MAAAVLRASSDDERVVWSESELLFFAGSVVRLHISQTKCNCHCVHPPPPAHSANHWLAYAQQKVSMSLRCFFSLIIWRVETMLLMISFFFSSPARYFSGGPREPDGMGFHFWGVGRIRRAFAEVFYGIRSGR